MLRKEIVEPGNSSNCLVTEYTLDSWGHRTQSTVRNCNGSAGTVSGAVTEAAAPGAPAAFVSRVSNLTYTGDKRFIASQSNALA
jgi:hypothetical protein